MVWCLCENDLVLPDAECQGNSKRAMAIREVVKNEDAKSQPTTHHPGAPLVIYPPFAPSLVASPAPRYACPARPALPTNLLSFLSRRVVCIAALRVTRVTVPPASAASYAAPAGRNTLVRASRPTESLRAKRHRAKARPVGEDDRTPRGEGGGERSCQKARGGGGREGGGDFVGG